jgi:putative methyltransferase (TIGR04325 family)
MPAPHPDIPFGHSGDYSTWEEASSLCTGFQADLEEKFRSATVAVLRGDAVHTRDGGLFPEIIYSLPLLAGLMYCAAAEQGHLEVLDFGGALGVSYLQNRRFLDRLPNVMWHIVERECYVEFGQREIQHPRLRFHASIDDCLQQVAPKVFLVSGVLQYLCEPYEFLRTIMALPFQHILMDRLSLHGEPRDRLTIFRPSLEASAYETTPWWFFNEAKLLSLVGEQFDLVERFETLGGSIVPSNYVALIWSRRNTASTQR